MAKKKTTQQAKDAKQQEETHTQIHPVKPTSTAMEDPAEKLKQLNVMLLKETTQTRLQVESLGKEKEVLEAELTRSRNALDAERSRAAEEVAKLEVEKGAMSVFVATQLEKMGEELESVKKERASQVGVLEKKVTELIAELESQSSDLNSLGLERDEVRSELDLWIRDANELKEKLVEMEKKGTKFGEELGKLRNEHKALIGEKETRERALHALTMEKDSLEINLVEKVELTENLQREIGEVVREKSQIDAEKREQQGKIVELENNLVNLDDTVLRLQKEEVLLQGMVRELEKKSVDAMEKEEAMVMEVNALVEEKKKKEATIYGLLQEKSSLIESLGAVKTESEDRERRLNALSRQKNEVEGVKASQELEIVSLQREASKLRDDLSELQQSCTKQEEKSKQLLSDVSHYKDAFEKALCEKENLKKNFDEKCKKIVDLNEEVAELNKRMEENVEELKHMKAKCERLQGENNRIESCAASLSMEKDSLVKKLSNAEQCIDSMRLKVELANTNSEQVLALLKNTATLVSQSNIKWSGKEDMGTGKEQLQAEIQPYLAELEAIKEAFCNKDRLMEDLNRQLESLGNLVEEAQKKKSFWTLVSSATTIFAAISIAYVARGH